MHAQKMLLRALHALTGLDAVSVGVDEQNLTVDGVVIPRTLPLISQLREVLARHSVKRLSIDRGARAADLLAFLRAVSSEPTERSEDTLAGFSEGEAEVTLRTIHLNSEGERERSSVAVNAAFESAGLMEPPAVKQGLAEEMLRKELEAQAARIRELVAGRGERAGETRPEIDLIRLPRQIKRGFSYGLNDIVLKVLHGLVKLEASEKSPEGVAHAIDEILDGGNLLRLVHLAYKPEFIGDVMAVLCRSGEFGMDAVYQLVEEIERSGTGKELILVMREEPGVVDLIRGSLESSDQALARKAAVVAGALRIEESVDDLRHALSFPDTGVRASVATSLEMIGSPEAMEILDRVRRIQLLLEGGGELAPQDTRERQAISDELVRLVERERSADKRVEYFRALGSVGTPDAIRVLIRHAMPGGRFFGKRPVTQRLEAIEGLRLARSPAARGALEELLHDRNREIQQRARGALDELEA